jgi:beta-glucosidase
MIIRFVLAAAACLGLSGAATAQRANAATQADWRAMMDSLHIDTLRQGADGNNPSAPNAANYDESRANPYPDLPDPLRLRDGHPVTTAVEWWRVRRPEIVSDFDREVYGRDPSGIPAVRWEVVSITNEKNGDYSVITKKLVGHVDNSAFPEDTVDIQLTLSTPATASGPVPVMMEFGFVFPRGIRFPTPPATVYPNPMPPGATKDGANYPPWQQLLLARGWGYATLVPVSAQADNGAGLTRGIIGLMNHGARRSPDQWGALKAWAWAASRALDYFETDKAVDARQVGIEGHSRYGKAALVTMAYDSRFAIGYISSSGEAGAKLSRRNAGELVENVASSGEYHWMAGNFIKYAGPLHWNDLPVDAHELIALCAPRPVFISGGSKGDGWVDARGMFMAAVAAGPVYELLGRHGLGTTHFPAAGVPLISGEIAWRQHFGGHTPVNNWPTFLEFASRYIHLHPVAIHLPYQDPRLPLETRVHDLISRMSLSEKVSQMMNDAPPIGRLGVPRYEWWSEALHGVARSGTATIFPEPIGMAATFDDSLVHQVGSAISDEARAMYNAAVREDYRQRFGGLTFWTPNINIFRDPRWGRGQETYGEDPFLTARMGVALVRGMQGDDPHYLKIAACAKHYAVHSGPEKLRHVFNAVASPHDLWDTYLPAFHALVTDAHVEAVMCAYNRTNDEACCSNTFLLQDVLRDQWHFKGHIVTDCDALQDIYEGHKLAPDRVHAAALALQRGVNLNCGDTYGALTDAVAQGLVTESLLDSSLAVLLRTRFRLGMFDPSTPFDHIPASVINSPAHRALALDAARKSLVLLKNNGVLPLKDNLATYFLTGPNAAATDVLLGNYFGVNPNLVTILEGLSGHIRPGSQLQYKQGILLDRENINPIDWTTGDARSADACIVVLGISGLLEGEEGESIASPSAGDRLDYNIPANQIEFLRKIKVGNPHPVIAVITGGSPMNLSEIQDLADAVLLVWYPGEEGGNAVADVLFGRVSPSGKLPVTFPKSFDQLPAYTDYGMKGRTYRYMDSVPMYPFGFGLSYTTFAFSGLHASRSAVDVTVRNTGPMASDEVVQLYLTYPDVPGAPRYALKGFKRLHLGVGEHRLVHFAMTPEMLALVNDAGQSYVPSGRLVINVADALPSARSAALGATPPATATLP